MSDASVEAVVDLVLAGRDAVVTGPGLRRVLDGVAGRLKESRSRVVRIAGLGSGEISLSALMAEVSSVEDLTAQDDAVLEHGFKTLTETGDRCDRVVLIVDRAEALQPAALRYVQFAGRAGGALRLVMGGGAAFVAGLGAAGFAALQERLAVHSPIVADEVAPLPAVTALPQRRRWVAWAAIGSAMAASAALGVGIDRLAFPAVPPSVQAELAPVPVVSVQPAAVVPLPPREAEVQPGPHPQADAIPVPAPGVATASPPPGVLTEPTPEPTQTPPPAPRQLAVRRALPQLRTASSGRPAQRRRETAFDSEYAPPGPWAQAYDRPPSYVGTYSADGSGYRTFRYGP